MLVTAAIQESSHLTANACRRQYMRRMDDEWSHVKMELLDKLGFQYDATGAVEQVPTQVCSLYSVHTMALVLI